MIFKSKDSGDTILPFEWDLKKYAEKLAEEAVADFRKRLDSIND